VGPGCAPVDDPAVGGHEGGRVVRERRLPWGGVVRITERREAATGTGVCGWGDRAGWAGSLAGRRGRRCGSGPGAHGDAAAVRSNRDRGEGLGFIRPPLHLKSPPPPPNHHHTAGGGQEGTGVGAGGVEDDDGGDRRDGRAEQHPAEHHRPKGGREGRRGEEKGGGGPRFVWAGGSQTPPVPSPPPPLIAMGENPEGGGTFSPPTPAVWTPSHATWGSP